MHFLITLFALGVLVAVHELGHFLAARFFGVRIDKFSIGFGPKIFSFKKGQTVYALSLIPLGGFVKMKGENPEVDNEDVIINNDFDSFKAKTWWQRAVIAFSGPFFNILLAIFLFFVSYSVGKYYSDFAPIIYTADVPYTDYFKQNDKIISINDKEVKGWTDIYRLVEEQKTNKFIIFNHDSNLSSVETEEISVFIEDKLTFFNSLYPVTGTVIGEVSPGMPAWKSGLQVNDKILKIDGVEVSNWIQVREQVQKSQENEIILTVQRQIENNLKIFEIKVEPIVNPVNDRSDGESSQKIIGISQSMDITFYERNSLFDSAKLSLYTTGAFIYMNYKALYSLVRNPSSFKDSIGGPVMVFSMTSQSSAKGFSDLLSFVAALSILLMIMNLLPIPVLDGGHIIFCLIEGLIRKPVSQKIQMVAQQIGFMLLISLMLYAFYSDFNRLFQRSISKHEIQKSNSSFN